MIFAEKLLVRLVLQSSPVNIYEKFHNCACKKSKAWYISKTARWSCDTPVGVWLSLARALRSGRRGRRFKSSHPDHSFLNSFISIPYTRFFCLDSALKWTTNWTTPQGKCVSWQQKSRISSSVMASITSGVESPQFSPMACPWGKNLPENRQFDFWPPWCYTENKSKTLNLYL